MSFIRVVRCNEKWLVVHWKYKLLRETFNKQKRSERMKQNSNKGKNFRKSVYYAGAGMAIGAAIGMIFGLMLFENLAWGCVIGTAVGLVVGAAIDAHERR
jgi:uncharacterized membrane protein